MGISGDLLGFYGIHRYSIPSSKLSYTGWWYTYPSEKYMSVAMMIANLWKIKHVPNYEAVIYS